MMIAFSVRRDQWPPAAEARQQVFPDLLARFTEFKKK